MKPRPGQGSQLAGALESAGSGLRGETSLGSTGLDQARLDQEHELQRVEAALKRLDHGRFGHCLYCGDQIGLGRLKSDPAVESCDTCEEDEPGSPGPS